MATVLPLPANTNSTSSNTSRSRQPSLNSFPASVHSASHSTQSDSINTNLVLNHRYTHSNTSQQSRNNSHHSSSSVAPQLRSPRKHDHRKAKAIKSQYPPESSEKHVEYILVASFDIDRGSIMEHQYPGPVGGDEHMLAELMLPDQAHVRSQDWTIFFLHKDAGMEEEDAAETKRKRRLLRQKSLKGQDEQQEGRAEEGVEDEEDDEFDDDFDNASDDSSDEFSTDGPPLVYVLNLVNTKHDNTIKRGAIVKAMAICTRHSFLHIYKPLLLLALEQYFANPAIETLASLYNAVNSMDLSLLPRLNSFEKFILQASGAKDLFLEKFETMIAQRMAERQESDVDGHSDTMNTHVQSKARFGLPRDTHEFESIIRYANVPVPVKIPTAVSAETVGDFSLIKLINMFSTTHTQSAVAFSPTHPHLTTSGPHTHPIIVLLNAMLTQKRVIFLGHNKPSSEVAEAVLAACALASGGMLRGYTRHAFPYTDLTKIDDLLKVPGFIAGVTNPAFAHKTEWWDLLCDLSTGRMRISNHIEQAPLTEGVAFFQQNTHQLGTHAAGGQGGISAFMNAGASLSAGLGGYATPSGTVPGDQTGDGAFMHSVIAAINERHGENAIRSKFRRWILRFTRLAASFEEMVYGASALHIHNPDSPSTHFPPTAESPIEASKELSAEVTGHGYVWSTVQAKTVELAANATRIEGWRNTRSYYNFVQDLASHYAHRPIKHLDLEHLHDRLAKLRLSHEQSASIYSALCSAIQTEQEISQFLSIIAMGVWENKPIASSGQPGLLYISMGLFHPKTEVREEVAELLGRVKGHEAGRHFWTGLGRFVKIAWERVMLAKVERLGGVEDAQW